MRTAVLCLLLLGAGLIVVQSVTAQVGQIELLKGLELGLLRAEFRGNGDSSVYGRIWAAPGGPTQVTIEPGTQFWPLLSGRPGPGQGAYGQGGSGRGGFGQGGLGGGGFGQGGLGGGGFGRGGGGGGRQGMGGLGLLNLDLGGDRYAQVTIPTACTNLGVPSPTRRDVMIPAHCPDPRVASIAALHGELGIRPAAIQLAIWAIADDPPSTAVTGYLQRAVRAEKKADPESPVTPESLIAAAAGLLRKVGVTPQEFRLFQAAHTGGADEHILPAG